jgi:hypothetical protein
VPASVEFRCVLRVDCARRADIGPDRRVRFTPCRAEIAVHDVLFVLLSVGVFVLLALIVKGAEKL